MLLWSVCSHTRLLLITLLTTRPPENFSDFKLREEYMMQEAAKTAG